MKNHRLSVAGALGALVFAGSAFAEFRGFVAFVRNLDGKTVVDVFAGVGNSSDRLLNCYNRSISTSVTAGFVQESGAATQAWRPAPASNGRNSSVDSFMTIGVEGGAPYAGDFRPSGTTSADGAFVNWSASPAAAVPPNAGWYASPPSLPDNVAEDLSVVPGIRHDLSGAGGVSHGIWCAHLVVSNADPSFTVNFGGQASVKDGASNTLSQGSSSGTIFLTPDLDGDGVPDSVDACPSESGPLDCNGCPLNACGSCGTALDTDGDGSPDCVDADDDNDGYDDGVDAFPLDATEWQDTDGDGQGDNSDGDDDGDGVLDAGDNCPRNPNASQEDLDSDGSGDACDTDDDGDGASDMVDNCPAVANTDQSDVDGDGTGDACDSDDDNDGIGDDADNCDAIANPSQADCDSDGIGDACELAAGEADLNQNGRPDSCDIAWVPSGNAAGAFRWDAASGTGAGGQWYLLSAERVDLATAKARAAALGGRLASITSQAEWEFLRAVLAGVPSQSYWVGLERPCWCCGWIYASGEAYGRWNAPWNFQDCNTAVAVSYAGNWRTSAPAELRRYLIEFDFADLDHDGVLDAHDGQMAVDCNQDGQRDSQQIAITPSLDCDSSATLDSCDTARMPYYADQYVELPGAGETVVLNLPVNAGTSSSVRIRVDAVGDYGEPYKGEWVDVDIEGLALMRLQDAQCSWTGAERSFARVVAEPVLADGIIRITFTVGEGVDPQTCGSHSARVQAWYSLPTTTPDLNENGRPDVCDPGWTPDFSQLPGIVQRSPGHWYWVSNEVLNYPDAVVRARALGGRLVSVTSESEFEFIRTQLGVPARESFWMAMSRACGVPDLGNYAWTTGERVTFLPNWVHDTYYPVDPCYYTCALLVPGRGFHVAHQWWGSRYIVEFDLRDCNSNGQLDVFELQDPGLDCDVDGVLDSCGGMTGSDCDADQVPDRCEIRNGAADRDGNGRPDTCDFSWVPSGSASGAVRWDRSIGDRHWYKLVTDAVWYEEAAEIARRMGGHLLTITSQDEASFIEEMLRNSPGEYWLGMERRMESAAIADFVWRTGEGRSYEPYWWYNNPDHDAVALSTSEGWRSAPRTGEDRYFIVEFDFRDADGDGLFDWQEMIDPSLDCDRDGMLDAVQVAAGLRDCNSNGIPDRCDVAAGAPDWNQNGRPDSCDADWTPASDYPGARQMVRNGIGGKWYLLSPEATGYEVAKQRAAAMGGRLATLANPGEFGFVRNEVVAPTGTVFWVGMERQPGQCDTASFRWITGEPIRQALNWVGNGCWSFDAAIINSSGDFESRPRWEARRYLVEFDLADCNANGQRDWQEMLDVTLDSDNDGLLDSCELAAGYDDCNGNGVADAIDIVSGLPDANSNGRPDSCDSSWTPGGATAGAVRWQYGADSSGGGGGHWFLASTDRMDYYTAKDYARSLGGRLAAITSQAEWDFVRSTIAGNPDRTYWIGVERPCWCCGWQAISGESFGQWGPPWSVNDCNLAASVSYSSNWRSSNPFEQRHFLIEFDFDDVDGDGVLDAGQASQLVDCNQNGLRDPVEVALYPSLDCNENGRPDSCDTARAPFHADIYAALPSAGEELLVPLTVNPGTSSPVRIRVDAVSDLGEPVKGEWLDVDLEGLGTFRLQGSQCGWVGGERTFPMNVALPALADGRFTVRVTVGPGVDIAACGENRVRVQAWYSLPTLVDDLNQNGRPDSCEIGAEPPSSLSGVVERVPGQWYWLSDDARTYDGALARARELGGHLVTITSQAEWDFVRTRVGLSWGPLAWVGFERTCESNGLEGYAWTTGEARSFELPWIHTYTDCNWRWALMRTDGLHTGYAWWCCHHYIVEFDYRDCDGNGRLDMFDPASSGPDCDGDGVFDGCQLSTETDCDDDGVLDTCQIASGAGDADGDGVLDVCEEVYGDLNGDGIVDGFDLTVLLAAWGETGANPADLNGDGVVNGADLGIVLANWGSTGQ